MWLGVQSWARVFLGGRKDWGDVTHLSYCSGPVPAAPLHRQLFPCQHLLIRNRTKTPKSSQMAQILYSCQSALEFNNNLEVKLRPSLIANPQNHLAFSFLWITVKCMCRGRGVDGDREPEQTDLKFLKGQSALLQSRVFLLGQRAKLVLSIASPSLTARKLHHATPDKPPSLVLLMKWCPKEACKSVIMFLRLKKMGGGADYVFAFEFSIRYSTVLEIWELFHEYLFIPVLCSTKELN